MSNIAELFKGVHGAIVYEDLVPLKDKLNHEDFPTKQQFAEALEYLGISESRLFFDPNGSIHPIIYLHEFNYMPIFRLKWRR